MSTGKDEISKKEDEALVSTRQMFDAVGAEDEAIEAVEEAERNASVDDAVADADADAEKAATNEDSPVPKPAAADDDKKKKQKDPMMELVDELNGFVQAVNDQITGFVKEKGKDAWDKLNDTEPMKTLNGAMSELSQFAKDKIGEKVDKITDSQEVSDAKDFIKGLQDTVNGAFSKLMNMAANSVANAVKGITSSGPSTSPDPDPSPQASEDTAEDAFAKDGIDELDELNAEPELANEDEVEISAKMDTPSDSLTSTTDEPMNALSDSMGDMGGPGSGAPGVDSDLTEEVSSGLSNAM
ncbi:MAG: hypothetical protein LEGION0403_FIIPPAGN_00686 [Legionella sp.]|uniref:hypothetical protein n=1 Tax=Legionella sp. TaxID=459 RepID=UPI003D0BEFD2